MDQLADLQNWLGEHVRLVAEWAGLWVAVLVLTVVAVRYYLVWIPADHFAKGHHSLEAWRDAHPALRWTVLVTKNLIGAVLVLVGLIMLVAPGPGLLAILLGLSLVDIPGKRAVEQRIVQRPAILAFINHVRAKANKPPLQFTPLHS